MIDRMDRVSKALNREISAILQEDIDDPRIESVVITEVKVTRDMRLAKVFYVVYSDEEKKEVAKGLKSASKFVRGELAKRLSMKYIPEISFREDLTEKRKQEVGRLFEVIEKESEIDTPEEGEE
jgi:ribosome-binding factor A